MKIGAFMLGGLVGAAAAVMLSRNNRSKWMMAGLSSAGESVGQMLNKNNWLAGNRDSRKWSSDAENGQATPIKHGSSHAAGAGHEHVQSHAQTVAKSDTHADEKGILNQVKEIVDKDLELKKHVSQILSENETHSAFNSH
ncbi:hypothetical protein [Paenibacillus sp. MBLB4367]|uniref:hypothetical protein n=1 Tax=Paenibacillus sp. MBLB4367 TaxID=3384767 RepID=UPI0039081037